MFKCLI